MRTKQNSTQLNQAQYWGFIILRMIIGWYFLYEGIVKLMNPEWSAESFLMNAHGFLSGLFHWMASQPAVLEVVNFLNVWGLILIGLGLLLGFLARIAVYAGILLLFFYYIAYLPIGGLNYGVPQEGHYLLINKNFIVLSILVLLALFPRTLNIGLWSLIKRVKFRIRFPSFITKQKAEPSGTASERSESRREMVKHLAFLPFLGGFTWALMSNKKYIPSKAETDVITGSTITLNRKSLNELEGQIPHGKLENKLLSRVIIGSNLIGGWSHARDLKYVSRLFKAYNTEKKVFETLMLAEKVGINTINLVSGQLPLINRYKKLFGSNIQTMVQVGAAGARDHTEKLICEDIDRSLDLGMDFIQIWGVDGDFFANHRKTDEMGRCISYAKEKGLPVGIGAHDIHSYYIYDEAGIPEPDFYFKTMHHDNYWSAHPRENRAPFNLGKSSEVNDHNKHHDNMWDLFPDKTVDYVQKIKKPVVAYKVLAAGAIPPEEGFQYAFGNGADFICVGMLDFQIVEDANYAIQAIDKAKDRSRPWYG